MVTLDQVEKLRKYGNISYDQAKKALEEADGDILEAIIILEGQGLIEEPEGGGYHKSINQEAIGDDQEETKSDHGPKENGGTSFSELVRRISKWIGEIVGKGNRNHFEVAKEEKKIITIPVTILALLLMFMFWITVPLIIVGLFFGYRYSFTGPDLGKENVNRAMDSVADAAENLKKEVKGEKANGEDSHN